MGLDMMAFTTIERLTSEVDFDVEQLEELHFWRKHPNLHGWMKRLYHAKGGRDRTFNCSNLALNLSDLNNLEKVIQDGALPFTAGFFFGTSEGSEKDDDLTFIGKARAAINGGMSVFYRPWW